MKPRLPLLPVELRRTILENPEIFDVSTLAVYWFLWAIDSGERIEKREIYERLGIRRQTFNAIIKNLEKSGFLVRLTHSNDYRLHVRLVSRYNSEVGPLGAQPISPPGEVGPLGAQPMTDLTEVGPIGAQPTETMGLQEPNLGLGGGGGYAYTEKPGEARTAFSARKGTTGPQMLSIQDILTVLGPSWEVATRLFPPLHPSQLIPHLKEARQWMGSPFAGDERFKGAFFFWLNRLDRGEILREPLAVLRFDMREGHYSTPPKNLSKEVAKNAKKDRALDPLEGATSDEFVSAVIKAAPFFEKHVEKGVFFRSWEAAYGHLSAWKIAQERINALILRGEIKFKEPKIGAETVEIGHKRPSQ